MTARPFNLTLCCSLLAVAAFPAWISVSAQQPAAGQSTPQTTTPADQQPGATTPVTKLSVHPAEPAPVVLNSFEQGDNARPIREDELRQQLQGKTFYLRGDYLDNTLHFDEQGKLSSNSPQTSYTLSLVEITHVRLEHHRLYLEGVRYGLHFLGASPTEDQSAAIDRVRLTTKKKPMVITIDREQVSKPKKEKEKHEKHRGPQSVENAAPAAATKPADAATVETDRHRALTDSQASANRTLAKALDTVFATGIDNRMIATLPDYWKRYYQSIAAHRPYKPDPGVLHQGDVDQKAKLISMVDPPSNELAQKNGVAGMAVYHVVIGTDGKPREIAVDRPIGFGLDENAVKAIQQAKFEPAMKGGFPVPVTLDLLVQFRIYSKLTAEASNQPAQPNAPILPGPYTANAPKPQPQPDSQPDATQQQAPADAAPQAPGQAPAQAPAPSDAPQQPTPPQPGAQPAPQQPPATPPAQQPQ